LGVAVALVIVAIGSLLPSEEVVMSVLVRWVPPSLTAEQYDEAVRRLEQGGAFPPDGLDYHVCFKVDGNYRVSEIWDSEGQLRAFGERLMPVLSEVGIDPGEPELLEIHNIMRR
jgi:hypothetical protein